MVKVIPVKEGFCFCGEKANFRIEIEGVISTQDLTICKTCAKEIVFCLVDQM